MNGWQAVVFDLDDTLYPERDYVFSGFRAVALWVENELGLSADGSFVELRRLFETGIRGNTFDRFLASHGLNTDRHVRGGSEATSGHSRLSLRESTFFRGAKGDILFASSLTAMVQTYRQHEPQISLDDATRAMLRRLGLRCRLGLITDGYLDVQRRKVAALNLTGLFHAIVYSASLAAGGTDALGRDAWKPSPKPFQAALGRLSVEAAKAIYVGDNPAKDFRGARQVGMTTVRVRRPDGLHRYREPNLAEDAPDVEIDALDRLPGLLGRMEPPAAGRQEAA